MSPPPPDDDLQVVLARLRQGPASQAECVTTAQRLMARYRWLEAAELWALARQTTTLDRAPRLDTLSIAQQALCISKERVTLRLDEAFGQSVQVLEAGGLRHTTDQETLGIAGGIYKRFWDTFRQRQHLQEALGYYERGWRAGRTADDGYTGINAAYVADVIAYVEETIAQQSGTPPPPSVQGYRQAAQECRAALVAAGPALGARVASLTAVGPDAWSPNEHPWWILVTLAEAHFGLARDDGAHYARAEEYLREALRLDGIPSWMVETTARQLGAMARMQAVSHGTGTDARPWQVLEVLLERVPSLRTEVGGKIGLALSGGGFRASLFHIGVLARLAELDMLRHVEVISCVSGGSIIGALYYLRLRALLQEKRDGEIEPPDYVAIVRGLETDFLQAIQQNNFRMRMLEQFSTNLAMLRNRQSRTEALGRVMGRVLYGSDTTYMDEVTIRPPDGEPGFDHPVHYNWRRRNKIPLLVLNATNQAGGHAWHFTPYEMGEPQLSAIDANPLLERRPYDAIHRSHVWRAVSASACVPVLFEPIRVAFAGASVDLLDGGVHDNQGTSALLDRDCTLLLVSDASGHLANDATASTSFAAVGVRADAIVQERLRIALYEALEARRRGSLLRGMMFLHLRLGLGATDDTPTPYHVPTGVQRRLSAIRTDLDVFHDAEALSLMLSGYHMAAGELPRQLPHVTTPVPLAGAWTFRGFEPRVMPQPSPRLLAMLDVSRGRLFKAWRAVPALKWTGRAAAVVAAVAVLWTLIHLLQSPGVIPVSTLTQTLVAAVIVGLLERLLRVKIPNWKKEVAFAAMAVIGAALAWVHARYLDPAYLRAGRRDRT